MAKVEENPANQFRNHLEYNYARIDYWYYNSQILQKLKEIVNSRKNTSFLFIPKKANYCGEFYYMYL